MHTSATTISLQDGSISGLRIRSGRQPLLLLHGNSSCKEIFAPLLGILEPIGIDALAIDLPGHGQSHDAKNADSTYCFPGYANVVFDVLEELGWPEAGLIGWSLGGHIALECLARPDASTRITSALVIGAPPRSPLTRSLRGCLRR
jgi:pimeloyl-ACP methyl ester carboxylesterase